MFWTCLLLLTQATARSAPADHAAHANAIDATYTYTIAPFVAEYEPPAPGTYALPAIDAIDDHPVVDSTGTGRTLFAVKRGRLAVVAFVYTTCAEATGCPLAEAVLQRLDRKLAEEPDLAQRVRLLTLSFDPERDTPARMATVRGFYQPKTDWIFLTTRNDAALRPVLDDFGQPVAKLRYDDGTWTGLFRHVLKVYLLDEENRIRNIYSTGMMTPELVLNDIRTLVIERP
jgi:cytochrome c peroxidase